MSRKTTIRLLEVLAIILFILFLSPLGIIVMNSAKDSFAITSDPLKLPDNWGQMITNIVSVWNNPNVGYKDALLSSTIVTITSLFFITIFSSMAAWVLVRTKTKTSTIIFMLFVGAMVIPFQIVMFPLLRWFRNLQQIIDIKLLGNQLGLIFAYIGFGSSLSIFMFHGFIKSIPYELEEAAKIDGCSRIKTFFYIILPILKPIYVTVLILNGIWIWNDFLLPFLMVGTGNPNQTIPLAVQNFSGAYVVQWDLKLTAIVMAIVPVVIFFLYAQKHIIKGMVEGSIK